MALNIFTSNKIEELTTIFCSRIKHKNSWNQTSNIIVQTAGIKEWLIKEVSSRNRIFANYEFSSPDSFIGKINYLALNYTSHYFSKDNIKWKIFIYLSDPEFIKNFPTVSKYYLGDEIKRIQLADKVADLFDQYQIYRPTLISDWNNDNETNTTDNNFKEQETWQRWLWRKLKSESDNRYDNLQVKLQLMEKMETDDFKNLLQEKFPHIHLFGLAVLSDYHWDIYNKLASIIDISLYVSSPTPGENLNNKASLNHNNELLASCNQLTTNLHKLLPMTGTRAIYKEPSGSSLLATIQQDIFANTNTGIKSYETTRDDNSIQVVSSYTPVREVEALYNHLLNAFEKNPDLKGNQVSVQMPDVNIYAPLIKAVFDNAPKKIPYVIADQSFSVGDSLIKALELFINLPFTNFKTENVLQLLDFMAVRSKFDIDDIGLVREIIADANIRFGIQGNKEDDSYLYSWEHGLRKLVLGYAIKGGNSFTFDDTELFPCDAFEGSEALNIFKIKAFIETIIRLQEQAQAKKTLIEWKEFLLNQIFKDLFNVDDYYNDEFDYIHKKLETFSFETIDIKEEVSFNVFHEGLISLLNAETPHSVYSSGLVTFSSMMSVRSIPFKHIAILGLNSNEFPRQVTNSGFDLMALLPLDNDRNRKNNDKHLFLECLLSAKDQIYLSYIGSSIKDNSEIPPSLLIEELEDYVITGTGDKNWFEAKIKYKHPLHANSKLYFENDKFFTYLGQSGEESFTELSKNSLREAADISIEEISIDDLVRFYTDPFKWYYNKTLNIYYNDDAILLPEEEIFTLDNLQKWAIKNDLVTLNAEQEDAYIKRKKNNGEIQLANMAKAELELEKEDVERIQKQFKIFAIGEAGSENINLKLNGSVLKGSIKNIYDGGQVVYNVSKANRQAKYFMSAFIKHLAYKAINENAKTIFISSDLHFVLNESFVEASEAKSILAKLIEIFKQGHEEIIPFIPQAGLNLMNNLYHIKTPMDKEKAITEAFKNFWGYNRGAIYFNSSYIEKEYYSRYFEQVISDKAFLSEEQQLKANKLQASLLQISEILFKKLSTFLSIQ